MLALLVLGPHFTKWQGSQWQVFLSLWLNDVFKVP